MTKDTAEFSQFTDVVACREYTFPRDEETSEPKGWIRGNTKIGPVLEVTTCCLQGEYGVEIRIKSMIWKTWPKRLSAWAWDGKKRVLPLLLGRSRSTNLVMLLRLSATVAYVGFGVWWTAWRHWERGWTIRDVQKPACGTGSPKQTPCFRRRRLCSVIPNCQWRGVLIDAFYSTCVPAALHGAGEWAYTQWMFQALRIWELGKLRRVLCLRRVDYMKRTGVIVARQLKKHNQQRVQTLAMRRVPFAAWQMVSCPSDANGRRYWEESVTWRCDDLWREEYIKLSKEDYRNSTQWKRPLPGRPNYWERPSTRFLGDAWIPKLKACNTWTEWLSLTKEFGHSWHAMLKLKTTWVFVCLRCPCWTFKKTRWWKWSLDCCLAIWYTSSFGSFGWQQGCDQLDEWCLRSQGRRARCSCPWCGGSICAVGSWVVFSGQELMKMTGVGISFASQTKLRTHMLTGWWTMVILVLERNGWRLISTINCKHYVILCCLSMGPERRVDLVRLRGFCSYGMNTVFLRKSLMVDVCWGMRQQWLLNVRPWEWALNIWQFNFRQRLARLIFKSSAQIGQYSTNLMRSLYVSSVFTGMWMTRIAPVRNVSKTKQQLVGQNFSWLRLNAGDFASRSKAKAKPQGRTLASSSTRTILIGERTWTDIVAKVYLFALRFFSVEETDPSSSSWKPTSRQWWSDWILENERLSSESFCVLSSLVWWSVEEQHGKRRRKQEKIPVLYWFIRSNSVHPSSLASFRTQYYWSYFTGQFHYSGQFLQVYLSCRMCNQFTFHHQLWIDIGRSTFEQSTDSVLSACGSHGRKPLGSWHDRLGSTASCTMHEQSMEETSEHGVLGWHQPCSEKRIVPSNTIDRYHSSWNTPSLLYPESCSDGNWRILLQESICVTSTSSEDFHETWLDERIRFRSCSTTRGRCCATQSKSSQIQIQIMIERRNPLFAFKEEQEKHPVLRRSKHVLVVKKMWNMIERWNPLFAVTQVTSKEHPKHVSLMTARTSMLKIKQIMTERRNPLFALMQITSDQC